MLIPQVHSGSKGHKEVKTDEPFFTRTARFDINTRIFWIHAPRILLFSKAPMAFRCGQNYTDSKNMLKT